ncbi:MAG TPA: ATP-binding protein [Polyangiaceae bacterium]|nr:ATP-binding protein [Polyangiaceae bacterium]
MSASQLSPLDEPAASSTPESGAAAVQEIARRAARLDAYRVQLSDALRPWSDPLRIQSEAARVLGRQLGSSRVAYVEVEADGNSSRVEREYCGLGVSSLLGRWRLDDFGPTLMAKYREGHTFAVSDVSALGELTAAQRARYAALGIAAYAGVPLIKQGRLTAILTLHSAVPRCWGDEELALIEETAERTWAAVERARAEQVSRESAAKYRSLFDSIDEGFAILQLLFDGAGVTRDFIFVEINRAFARQMGVAATGKRALELLPNVEQCWIDVFGKVAITKQPVRFEQYVPVTGRWFSIHASALGEDENHQVAVVFSDITERKRREQNAAFLADIQDELARLSSAEEILAVVSAKLGSYLKLVGCSLAELYPATDQLRVRSTWGSNGQLEAAATPRLSEVVHREVLRLYQAGRPLVVFDSEADPRVDAQGCRTRGIRSLVGLPGARKDEGIFVFCVGDSGARDWREDELELLQDLSERLFQRLERAIADASLRETELRLQQALEAAGMGTFSWHLAEDRTEADPRLLSLFGLPSDGALSLELALKQLIHLDDRARYASAVARATDPAGSGRLREDIRVVHPDGGVHWLAIRAQATFESGRATCLTGMATDISDRRFAEDALRRSEQQLKESDRRKDEFLAVLAHELRNPLAPIRTGLELLHLSADLPDGGARVRGVMERQVNHMVRLVDDLLDVSRINSGSIRLQRQVMTLQSLVSTAIEAHRAALEAGQLRLELELPSEPLMLDVDPTRFVQVLSNLLHNAIKFTEPGGRIRVVAQSTLVAGSPRLQLAVEDSGSGISRELLPRVFELFTQGEPGAQRAAGGLGIGLALARRLIEMHGGSIEAFSGGRGRGSRFVIQLPLPAPAAAPQPSERAARPPAADRRVVVIDDNADAADTLALLIEALGGECKVAYDGEAGVGAVLEFQPDVVLLDIGMPGIDGYETCRRIRLQRGSKPLIVALTGWGQARDKERALHAGFDLHLTKPASPAAIQELLARAPKARAGAEVSAQPVR